MRIIMRKINITKTNFKIIIIKTNIRIINIQNKINKKQMRLNKIQINYLMKIKIIMRINDKNKF